MAGMVRTTLSVIVLAALAAGLAGCVKRTITLRSQPDGAVVYLNDEEVGRTPTTVPFTWYGVYDVRLEKDGYRTLNTTHRAKAPWYETPGIDLAAELLPGTRHVDLQWQFQLEEARPVDEAILIDHGRQLRAKLNRE